MIGAHARIEAGSDAEPHPTADHPAGATLWLSASPEALRSALLPEDRQAFDEAWAAALADARASLDLTALFSMLESWRGVAVLQSDPARFRAVARRAAEKLNGQPSPEDEPLAITRAKAGL